MFFESFSSFLFCSFYFTLVYFVSDLIIKSCNEVLCQKVVLLMRLCPCNLLNFAQSQSQWQYKLSVVSYQFLVWLVKLI